MFVMVLSKNFGYLGDFVQSSLLSSSHLNAATDSLLTCFYVGRVFVWSSVHPVARPLVLYFIVFLQWMTRLRAN